MRTLKLLLVVMLSASALPVIAADTGERTYADPACSARDADPAKCVINDGLPRVIAGSAAVNNAGANPSTSAPSQHGFAIGSGGSGMANGGGKK